MLRANGKVTEHLKNSNSNISRLQLLGQLAVFHLIYSKKLRVHEAVCVL